MNQIGLFYGTSTAKTAAMAQKIAAHFAEGEIVAISVEEAARKDFLAYDRLIVGTSTWFDGELPSYWDELLPELEGLDLTGKKVALFGLGNQERYPDNFVDGIGILAEVFQACGATLIGRTSSEGYCFIHSKALKDHLLSGLALDIETQAEQNDERISSWVAQLKKEW